MKLELQNVPIGPRIALALALPIVGLLFLAAWLSFDYHRSARQMDRLGSMAELAPAISGLIHELQTERGLSAGHLGSGYATDSASDITFVKRLPLQQAATDDRHREFEEHLAKLERDRQWGNQNENLRARITSVREHLAKLPEIRRAVSEHNTDVHTASSHYAEAIAQLIGIGEEMLLLSSLPELTRTIAAYTHLLNIKEQVGQERALGVAGFSAGRFDHKTLARLIERIDRQRYHLGEFGFFATQRQIDFFNQTLYGVNEAEVSRMRRIALNSRETGSTGGISAAHWFVSMSQKIDRLQALENLLASDMLQIVQYHQQTATNAAWRISLLTLALVAFTIALAAALARGILLPLQRMTRAMAGLAAQDENIQIEDAGRGDEIGALARAAQVFRDNQIEIAESREKIKTATALRLHHQALSSIVQGVLITDMEGRVLYTNVAFNTIFGFSAGSFPDDPPAPLDKQHGSETACLQDLLPAFASGKPYQGELQCRRRNGEPFWCALTVTPVLDATDRPTHLVGVMRDITESRIVEQELRIAATAFESLHGMMVTDARGTILRVNKAFVDMTGYSVAESIGQSPAMLKSGRHPPEFYAAMWQQLAISGTWSGEIWDRRKNGEIYPKWQTISAVRGSNDQVTHFVSAFTDISERKEAEQRIHDLAFYDPLTNLPNRRLLIDRLQQALSASSRNGHYGALLFLDLDQFKTLNDTLGHDMGDLLLIQVAERLQTCLRGSDTAARLGGDEFVVMLDDLGNAVESAIADAETVGEKILSILNRDYDLAGRKYRSTPSIGVTLYHGNQSSIDELLKQADLAMYQAKAAGRNAMRFYDPQMQAVVSARSELEDDLRTALREQQFVLHYQPQVDSAGQTIGAEALVRWQHPRRGLIGPVEFIPLAEETGLILPLGKWVLSHACARLAEWRRHIATQHLTLSINVSARQFHQSDFVAQILDTLAATDADPHQLKLELTESLLLNDIESTITKMEELKVHGISFSLDDFGTGYSSLAYLKRLPLDQLKIDRSFVRDIINNPNDAIIAKSIVALGHSLGLNVIAEGVETEAQHAFLAANCCTSFQGYLFGKPAAETKASKPE